MVAAVGSGSSTRIQPRELERTPEKKPVERAGRTGGATGTASGASPSVTERAAVEPSRTRATLQSATNTRTMMRADEDRLRTALLGSRTGAAPLTSTATRTAASATAAGATAARTAGAPGAAPAQQAGGTSPLTDAQKKELDATADAYVDRAKKGDPAGVAKDWAAKSEGLSDAEQDYLTAAMVNKDADATARVLDQVIPASGKPSAGQAAIAKSVGRAYDSGAIDHADMEKLASQRNHGGFLSPADPAAISRVFAASGSAALKADAAGVFMREADAGFWPFHRSAYRDAALAMGPAAMADAFHADPALQTSFLASASDAQKTRLMTDFNAYQASTRINPYPGANIDTMGQDRLTAIDETFRQLGIANFGGANHDLQAQLDTWVTNNAKRDSFVDTAFGADLAKGEKSDQLRDFIHRSFQPLGMDGSHEIMQRIRDTGQLDHFLDATLRDENGKAVDVRIRDAVKEMLQTGRLDVYAETLSSTPLTAHDPAVSKRSSDPHYSPSDDGIYFTFDTLKNTSTSDLAKTMAHEVYHAFNADHGGPSGALNEGLGIGAIHYAFENGDYSLAEATYGTKNFYRDRATNPDPNYPIGDMSHADAKLTEFVNAMSARDSSHLNWSDPKMLQQEYDSFWKPFNRFEDKNGDGSPDWFGTGGYAEQAQAAMDAARAAGHPGVP